MLYVEQEKGSLKQVDEVFNLGQKQCPWSKQFLLESARNRPSSSKHLRVVYNISANAGYNCTATSGRSSVVDPDSLGTTQMAHNFDNSLDFGDTRPLTGFRSLKHPFVVLSHIAFRGFAIFFYIFANIFSSSFIVQFLILLSFFSADFWTVKNITGRLLVGLRACSWHILLVASVSVAFITFQWQWMVIGLLGLAMGLANLYGYLRCKWSNTQELLTT
uniref:Golgi apparatus membrane protein TVP23 homolog n=1 Tax=Ditylenchus dipsaci TaxID=166011 RepID=A0A915DZT8_9BILA